MTPIEELELSFVFAGDRRITTTREPVSRLAPSFVLVRDAASCAWAVGAHVAADVAEQLDALAVHERPTNDLTQPPLHEARYRALLGERVTFGPLYAFPAQIEAPAHATTRIDDEQALARHFRGWAPGEIAAGCGPMLAVVVDDAPVSICFSARSSPVAAAAGLETATPFRGRGYAGIVTLAWARAIRASGRTPRYGTSWTNLASLANARKLGLLADASTWSIDKPA